MKKVLAKKHTALIACSALMAAALTGGLAGLTNVTAHAEEGDVTYAPKIYYYVDAGNFVKDNGSGERFTGRDSCDGEGVPHSNETNFMKAYGLHYGTKDEAGKVTGLYNGYADNQLKEDDKTGKTWGVDSTNYGWAKWRVLTTSSTNTLYDGYQTGRHTEGGDLTNDHYVMTYKFEVDDNTTPLKITIGARAYGNGWGQTSYKYSINKPSDYDAEENGAYPLETSITAPESDDNTEHVSSELWPTQTITGVKEGDKYFVTLKIGEDATNRNAYLNWIMIATDNYELPVAYSFPNFVKSDATTITATPSDGTGDVTATITDESKAALAAAAPLSNVDIAVDVGDGKTATGTVTVLPASTKYFVNVGSDHDVEGTVRDVQYSASNGYGYVSAQGTVGWADAPYDESNRYDVTDMTYRFDLEEGSYSVLVGTFTWWNHVRTATITANNGPAVALKNSSSANGTKDSATCYGDVTSASGGHLDVKFVCPEKAFITYFLVYEHEHGTMTKTEAVASTCETKGTIEYYTCEICGQKYDDENATTLITDIEAALLPHSGTHHEADPATCLAAGTKEYWECEKGCGKNYSDADYTDVLDSIVDPQKSHSGTHHEAVAESCTTDGNVEYWECENGCEKNYSDATYTTELEGSPVIAAHHTFDAVTWGAWTEKTEGGWTCTYSATCSVCGDTQSETGATVTSKETPATCIATGVRTYTAKAGNVTNPTEKTEEIAMLAHNGVKHEAAEPTCTEAGNNEYWSCDKGCDNVWSNATLETTTTLEAVTIAATGHDYDLENIEWTWTDTTAATAKVTCKTDNTHIDEITATITSAVTKQATETEEGETTYTATITVGDETYTTTKTAPIAKLTGNTAGGDDDGEKSGGCGSSIGGTVGMIAGLSVCLGAACATIFLRKKKIQK